MEDNLYAWTVRAGIKINGEKEKANCVFIILHPKYRFSYTKIDSGTIAHECFHAPSFILDFVVVKPDHNNDEDQAYLLGFIFEEVTMFIKP